MAADRNSKLLPQLPYLEKVVIAFSQDFGDDLRGPLLAHFRTVRSSGKLIVARADRDILDSGCRWVEEDPETLQSTGMSLWSLMGVHNSHGYRLCQAGRVCGMMMVVQVGLTISMGLARCGCGPECMKDHD